MEIKFVENENMIRKNAMSLHDESIVVDGLNASWFFEESVLRRIREGGITAFHGTVAAWHGLHETMNLIADFFRLFEERPHLVLAVRSGIDIRKAKETGSTGMILGFQDTAPLEGNLRMLAVYHALGVRVIQLTYNEENAMGFGCMAGQDRGLTSLGREAVAEMNRLGILVDLSHCGPKTTMDAVEASSVPVAFTHANPSALAESPRNKRDEAFKALAAKGGVAGAVLLPSWLTRHGRADLEDYLNALDYMVELMGVDHVGLGTDFMEEIPPEVMATALKGISEENLKQFYSATIVEGFESPERFPKVTEGLLSRGYNPQDVQKIMGGNWLRLYERVWQGL